MKKQIFILCLMLTSLLALNAQTTSNCPAPTSLVASNISTNGVTLTWVDTSGNTSWTLEYSTSATFASNVISQIISNSYTTDVINLENNKAYYARIKANCANSEYSSWATTNFRTGCGLLTNSLSDDFSSVNPASNLPYCWTRVKAYNNQYPLLDTSEGHNDSKSICFYAMGQGTETMIATPEFSGSISGLQVKFWVQRLSTNSPSKFEIGVMSDISDPNTFVLIREVTPTTTNWTEYLIPLRNAPATHKYIAFKMKVESLSTTTYHLDDVSVEPTPSCPIPTSVEATNAMLNSADISFSPSGSEAAWQYVITSNSLLTDPSTLVPVDITNSIFTISDLTANTPYRVWVRAKCSSSEFSAWSSPAVFRTACTDIGIGYLEDFNSYSDSIPACWTRVSDDDSEFPSIVGALPPVGLISNAVKFLEDAPIYLVMPRMNVPLSQIELSFKLNREGAGSGKFQVGYMSNPFEASTFVAVATYNDTEYKRLLQKSLLFVGVNDNGGANRYIAFRYGDADGTTTDTYWAYWIDDVAISAVPACPPPTNASVQNVTTSSATLSFTPSGTETAWQYVITDNASLTDPSTLTPVDVTTSTAIVISNLIINAEYRVWVRAKCSPSEFSAWIASPVSFRTSCAEIATLSEDFESYMESSHAIPTCWTRISSNPQYPSVINPSINDGLTTKSIKFGDSKPQYLVTPKFNVPLSTLQLEFKLKREGSESGKFQVGYMSNPADASTFVAIETFNDTQTQLIQKHVMLSGINDNGGANRYIAFRYGDADGATTDTDWFYFIDDINLSQAPTCSSPERVIFNNISSTSANVSFTPVGTATSWALEYKKSVDASWTSVGTITTPTHQLTGLLPQTRYDVRVKSICVAGTSESSYTAPASFTTDCGVQTMPFAEDFANAPNACWGKYNVLATDVFNGAAMVTLPGDQYWDYTTTNTHGINSPKMRVITFVSNLKAWLVTPTIALTGANKHLEFDIAYTLYGSNDMAEQTGTDDKFIVAIGTVDAAGATTWSATNATVWNNDGTGNYVLNNIPNTPQHITINLSAYSGNIKIGFYAESTISNADNNLSLDNISVSEYTALEPIVETLLADAITSTSATLHKQVTQGTEPIEEEGFYYKETSATAWISSTTGSLTRLTPATEYKFHAYAKVGTSVFSGDTLTFTTTDVPAVTQPTVTTVAATAITQTTATLNKAVTAGSEPITAEGWKYKKASDTQWTTTAVGAITGLTPNTAYEFYAYASTATLPEVKGETMSFTTEQVVGLDITEQNIKLYPNPAKDVIRLIVEGLSSKADISLIDMQGKVVGRYAIAKGGNSINIDVSSFAEGSYIVKVTSDNFNRTERLIIKK